MLLPDCPRLHRSLGAGGRYIGFRNRAEAGRLVGGGAGGRVIRPAARGGVHGSRSQTAPARGGVDAGGCMVCDAGVGSPAESRLGGPVHHLRRGDRHGAFLRADRAADSAGRWAALSQPNPAPAERATRPLVAAGQLPAGVRTGHAGGMAGRGRGLRADESVPADQRTWQPCRAAQQLWKFPGDVRDRSVTRGARFASPS
jgi:hypothetical protein